MIRRFVPSSMRARLRAWRSREPTGPGSAFTSAQRFVRIVLATFREAVAVHRGQTLYWHAQVTDQDNHFALRRNIHRWEKGLISRPRRDVFAVEYIRRTVELFATEVSSSAGPTEVVHLTWARDVLDDYFGQAEPHPEVDAARNEFSAVRELVAPSSNGRFAPFQRAPDCPDLPSYAQLLALARRRRSVRWFEDKPVPRALVRQALEVAAQSPSACNRQPFQFRIFDEPSMVRRVAELAAGTKGFNQNFPAIVVVVGRLRAYFHEKDRHIIYIDGALASMSFLFALETLGVSSCCINWPDIPANDRRMRRLLNLAEDERVVMLIAFGFPDTTGLVPYSGKRAVDSLASFNQITE